MTRTKSASVTWATLSWTPTLERLATIATMPGLPTLPTLPVPWPRVPGRLPDPVGLAGWRGGICLYRPLAPAGRRFGPC